MKKLVLILMLLGTTLVLTNCEVEQTRETELPDVEVDVEAGQLPAYDVDWADVNVGTRTKMVKVPKVIVTMEETEVEVPYLDIDMPNQGEDKEERTLMVEAEVSQKMQELNIQEVYAGGNRLYVIARLKATDQELKDEKVRVSDQLVLNAPEDLDVKYYIIGERPAGQFNSKYTYIQSISDIQKN